MKLNCIVKSALSISIIIVTVYIFNFSTKTKTIYDLSYPIVNCLMQKVIMLKKKHNYKQNIDISYIQNRYWEISKSECEEAFKIANDNFTRITNSTNQLSGFNTGLYAAAQAYVKSLVLLKFGNNNFTTLPERVVMPGGQVMRLVNNIYVPDQEINFRVILGWPYIYQKICSTPVRAVFADTCGMKK